MLERLKNKKVLAVVAGVALIAVLWSVVSSRSNKTTQAVAATAAVTRGDIAVTLSGSGNVEPISSQAVSAEVSGRLKAINVKNGQTVKAGDVLFVLENSDLQAQVEQARLNLRQTQLQISLKAESANNQNVRAPIAGRVTSLSAFKGQQVSSGQELLTIQDTGTMRFDATFNPADAARIRVGQRATVTSSDFAGSLTGTVVHVNNGLADGCVATIEVKNPSSLTAGMTMHAVVATATGTAECVADGSLELSAETTVKAQVSGTITRVLVSRNQTVSSGTLLIVIDSTQAKNDYAQQQLSLQQARINLEQLEAQLDKLTIKAPIDGVFAYSKRNSDSSDSTGSSDSSVATNAPYHLGEMVSSNETFGTILGAQGLAVAVPIDEVDISKVELGQVAQLTLDAVPDKTYTGRVIQIAPQGTVNNGVTDFPVTILIDDPSGLKPNMTADVTIKVAAKQNVLLLPVEAVHESNGTKFVILAGNSSAGGQNNQGSGQANSGLKDSSREGASRPSTGNSTGPQGQQTMQKRQVVTTGLVNDSMIEITSGLSEGDTVQLPTTSGTYSSNRQRMGGGMPGMGPGPRN